MPAHTLVVALDACDVAEARKLAATGRMPVLRALLESSASVETIAPPVGTYVSSLWPTLWTAQRPERHGYVCWMTLDSEWRYRETSPREARAEPFWIALSETGRRLALVDVPHTSAYEGLNGIMLSEWASHDRHFGMTAWPRELADEVVAEFGMHPIAGVDHDRPRQFAPCDWAHGGPWGTRDPDQARAVRDGLLQGLARKRDASVRLLDREHWDLFFVVIGETHCVGHQFWFLHDDHHDRYDAALAAELGDPVADVYQQADATLGRLVTAAGGDANVLVLFSHGMGVHYGGTHLLDEVLLGLAEHRRNGYGGRAGVVAGKRAWERLPVAARRRLHPVVARSVRSRGGRSLPSVAAEPLDERPFASFPNNDVIAAVRLNVIGREPRGVVPRDEYERVRSQLADDLLDLVNVESGEPAVDEIIRVESAFPARAPGEMADLYVRWNYRAQVNAVYSPKIGLLRVPYQHVRSGDHLPAGLLLAHGPAVAEGMHTGPRGVEDIAPTIAALLDTELSGVDGKPIEAILRAPAGAIR
jgi:predicted AlkP superfamily phosphohydrolase/phosphomutase